MPLDARSVAGTISMSKAASRRSDRQVMAWAAQAVADLAEPDVAGAGVTPEPDDGWTPALVGDALVEALKWERHCAGRTGPAGYGGMRLPGVILTDEDFLELGWGIRESADDPSDAPPLRIQLSARQISRHEAALQWPATYLCPDHVGSARMVGLRAACKAYKRPFAKAIEGRGVSRPAAYALRDKGLSLIAQKLTELLIEHYRT